MSRADEYLRRMRELGYEPSLAWMDDDDVEWELNRMDRGREATSPQPGRTVYRPVDPGLQARILRQFGQPYDESAIPKGQEFYLNGWDNGPVVQPLSADASGDDQKFQFGGTLQSGFQGPNPPKTQLQGNFPANNNSTPEAETKSPYGFVKPIASGTEAGYESDSGLDIGAPVSTPVVAAAGGKVVYAEAGHTLWQRRDSQTGEPIDTPYSVLIELDKPITFKDGRQANYIWYTHMSKLDIEKGDGDEQEIRVKPGQVIGYSGTANDSPHLHFGILSNRTQEKKGDYFTPAEVREMLGIKEKQKW